MDSRRVIKDLVPRVTPNAVVIDVEEGERTYAVTVAGTTSVTARCEVPRETVEAAAGSAEARTRLEHLLKRAADRTVAEVPDGRG